MFNKSQNYDPVTQFMVFQIELTKLLYCVQIHQPIGMNVRNETSIKNNGYQPVFDERDVNNKNDDFIGNVW